MIDVNNIKKSYKNFDLDLSLKIQAGETVGIVGKNGSGKSTFFKALLDLVTLDQGKISIFGQSNRDLRNEDFEKIGVVFPDMGFNELMTINDISAILDALYHSFDKHDFLKKVQAFGLPTKTAIKTFSTGMRAKLKVLIALSHPSKLLILDEPTAGLDVVARKDILNLIRDFQEREEATVLISSHVSSDIETLCDRLILLHDGKILLEEDTDVILDTYALLKMTEEQFESIEKDYLQYIKKEAYYYKCLTNQKVFYKENYPHLVIDDMTIDGLLATIIEGERL
ncbi:ABC transporter ATP-binding protein [Streptococcus thoraltensis]|uniref:ABC transporter ATP-binding protein n=1 Tax=Streptococcus thoraltensis TaxID=55085 RepID=UPI000365BF60|nr:ABC transporter ATP-binding protein [Streptococcus thoraltensis]MDY4761247.1 ABC transporter ATP-binding protein [Streptococcus thoraltensis]